MRYQDAIQFLWDRLPMFQRDGSKSYKADIGNITKLCEFLGNPHESFPCIHVAGTNGKGTTSHILAALLQNNYETVGIYSSPHYTDFRERIKINGKLIPKRSVASFVNQHQNLIVSMEASFFEVTVAMAFWYFAKEKVSFAIIEVGLGGRLDSTNIVSPELSVITNISLDHTDLLGDTIEEIALEKAGIIKPKIPVLIGEQQKSTTAIFKSVAKANQSPIYFSSNQIVLKRSPTISQTKYSLSFTESKNHSYILDIPLPGPFQGKNIQTALGAYMIHQKINYISKATILNTFIDFSNKMNYKGRWQILSDRPLIIADSGHNESGIQASSKYIKQHAGMTHLVLGFVKDKDWKNLLAYFPKTKCKYYFCKPKITRGLSVDEIEKEAISIKLDYLKFPSVTKALQAAKRTAGKDDLIFIGGSTFVVAEVV